MLTDFQNSFTDRFTSQFATKLSLIIPPHLNCVTTLPCEKIVMPKTGIYEASCHAKLSHSEQLLKLLTVILALFSSLAKRMQRACHTKIPTV